MFNIPVVTTITAAEYIAAAVKTEAPIVVGVCDRLIENARFVHSVMGLQTEIGELVDGLLKKHIFYNSSQDQINLKEEIGDLLWYLALMLDEAGLTFEECMATNIAKLKARYPDKFSEDKALNRDLETERKVLECQVPSQIPSSQVQDTLPSTSAPAT